MGEQGDGRYIRPGIAFLRFMAACQKLGIPHEARDRIWELVSDRWTDDAVTTLVLLFGEAVTRPTRSHQALVDQIDKVDWKKLHADIFSKTTPPELASLMDVDKYRDNETADSYDLYDDGEVNRVMKGGEKHHDQPTGPERTNIILSHLGIPVDASNMAKIAALYPRFVVAHGHRTDHG